MERKLTQNELSEIIGISCDHYGKIENGKGAGIDIYIALAELFHVSLDYLLLGKKDRCLEREEIQADILSCIDDLSAIINRMKR